jgi:glycosyltransferase involved in cell wall biosynthesis
MVMPSLQESFGVAVLEASAVGLPVIAGNVGGVPEVLDNNKTGLLVPPGDPEALAAAIMKLADDAELRKRMGDAGRKLVREKYLWESCLDKMTALYDSMISGDFKRN